VVCYNDEIDPRVVTRQLIILIGSHPSLPYGENKSTKGFPAM